MIFLQYTLSTGELVGSNWIEVPALPNGIGQVPYSGPWDVSRVRVNLETGLPEYYEGDSE